MAYHPSPSFFLPNFELRSTRAAASGVPLQHPFTHPHQGDLGSFSAFMKGGWETKVEILSHLTLLLSKAKTEADPRHGCLEYISVSLSCCPTLGDPLPSSRPGPQTHPPTPPALLLRTAAEVLTQGTLPPDRRVDGPCKVPVRSGSAVTFFVRSHSFPWAGPQHRRPLRFTLKSRGN